MKLLAYILVLIPTLSFAQLTKQDSVWLPLQFLLGTWNGKGGGEPGQGVYQRSYSLVLNKKFIEVRNKSTYPPTGKNLKGEVHEDIGYISYDKARKTFVLRQFHVEGFVNQYRIESISADAKTIAFVSESIENIPPGFRAKETYRITGESKFTETFELAEPGKEFAVYTSVEFIKK
jgi:hypothetical protein